MAMPDKIWSNGMLVEEKLMDFPGFRFYPTEEELLSFYLKKRIQPGHGLNFDKIMPTLDLYQYDPWELPGLAHDAGERQWFFFVPRYHKKCARPNRLTMSGYWKATGSDRKIRNGPLHCIGLKKTLVFYKGKGPRGQKTDWIMNEYRMPDLRSSAPQNQMDMVLCRIYRKAAAQKSLEQRSKPNDAEKEEPVVSSDEYEEKSHSLALNVSCAQSNPMIKAKVSSLNYVDHDDVCSFLSKTKDESNVFDSLEPLTFCEDQETLVLKTTESCKPPQLELPKLSMDFLFNKQIATPYALLATPSPFQIPHSSIPGL